MAKQILDRQLANVVLIDVVPGRPQGIALDLTQAAELEGHTHWILGTNDYDDTAQSDVVVVTAGKPRIPGMSRDDLALVNGPIVMETVRQAIARSPQARLIVVTNPHEILPAAAYLQGEYRQRDIYVGVPCRLGTSGVEAVLEVPLTEIEQAALQRSVLAVQGQVERVMNALMKQPATVSG